VTELATPLLSVLDTSTVGVKPTSRAIAHAMHARAMTTAKERRSFTACSGAKEFAASLDVCVGRSAIKPAAMTVADGSDQRLAGMLTMLCARLLVASDTGNAASLPASRHGSFPSRASNETTLRVIPFASVPIGANRNSFSPERRKAKASELAMLESCNTSEVSLLHIVHARN
jgi:hypothetical protein